MVILLRLVLRSLKSWNASGYICREIKKEGNEVTVKRMLEDGYMTIKMPTPCLVTCIKELNTPRYMSVSASSIATASL